MLSYTFCTLLLFCLVTYEYGSELRTLISRVSLCYGVFETKSRRVYTVLVAFRWQLYQFDAGQDVETVDVTCSSPCGIIPRICSIHFNRCVLSSVHPSSRLISESPSTSPSTGSSVRFCTRILLATSPQSHLRSEQSWMHYGVLQPWCISETEMTFVVFKDL